MKISRFQVLGALSAIAALALLATSGCAAWRIKQAMDLARQSEPFQAAPPDARARLLVVGDSTAVGTGASSPAYSVAGLISRDHPHLTIVNRARDGARFADITRQLQGDERFDAVLVLGGGNDVIRLTRQAPLAQSIDRTVALAKQRADLVLLMPSGNVGSAPFFFPPWSWLMSYRSRMLHRLVRQAAADQGALYVNLYQDRAEDPFAQQPKVFNAKDGLHPSDAGYRLWYRELNAQADLGRRLAGLRRP
jgi:lysophospholipase L1-like esterase